ncbi:hypothetical protein KKA14_18780 [bacterium]|nr:hypothetical protein [bacterium]
MTYKEDILTQRLINRILEQYSLPIFGIHGISHWARVLETGLRLAEKTNANITVVKLFAVFHDSMRQNEKRDNGHGARGADFAAVLRNDYFSISDNEFELLHRACSLHTDGLTEGNITVQTCWDSDRLDLNRVLIEPAPKFLCTETAKEKNTLDWANQRSKSRYMPELIKSKWKISEE